MLELKDFYHLPQLEALVQEIVADGPGLIVIAGLDPRLPSASAPPGEGFLPSGRSAIFRILMRQILTAHPSARAVVVTDDRDSVRFSRQLRRQVRLALVQPPQDFATAIAAAAFRGPGLLVVDRLCAETTAAALEAACNGLRVLSQLDTVFRGADVAQHLLELGASPEQLRGLRWVVAVERVATLCPHCKRPASSPPALADRLRAVAVPESGAFFEPAGCTHCNHTGRAGDVAAFDIYDAHTPDQARRLSLENYLLGLAAQGQIPLADALYLETDQLRRTYHLFAASERALTETNAALERKLAELEAANRVLQNRTQALISLHDLGQTLITSTGLDDLAARICRHARELCNADRAILYYLRSHNLAEVLAVSGWDPALIHQQLDAGLVAMAGTEPTPFHLSPPGVPPRHPDVEGVTLRAGLRVPLTAQGAPVGLMIVHTDRAADFAPGQVALLQTFASQAAVAMQRAGLIEQLEEKIIQLEAAQVELVEKERLEREMELARQVQQSVLPRVFPLMPGYRFGARNKPARRVGGDFYDVILLDGDRFGVVVADVSDKGMPAALYMALTRSLILAEARRDSSPRAVLSSVHRLLRELGQPDMFVTVFYGVVDGPIRRLTYCRAGHDRPLLLRKGEPLPLTGEGAFLGFPDLDDLHLSEETVALAPGDRLVLYTDGLTDALSPAGRPFGLGRLKATLQTHATLSPDELCTAVFADLSAYQGAAEQYDDMTILVVEVKNE
jgi:serine phosphatase RsbU (regulator of sigma subunit)